MNKLPMAYRTVTVTCLAVYDGTVFRIGYNTPEMVEQDNKIDYTARLYTLDELSFYGDEYLYFTLTDDEVGTYFMTLLQA